MEVIPLSRPKGLPTSCPSDPVLPPVSSRLPCRPAGAPPMASASLPQPLGMPERLPQARLPCTGGVSTSAPEASCTQLTSQDTGADLDLSLVSGLLHSCWGNRICSLATDCPCVPRYTQPVSYLLLQFQIPATSGAPSTPSPTATLSQNP